MTAQDVIDLIQQGGLLTLVLLIVLAGGRRIWVYGWMYDKQTQQLDQLIEAFDQLSRSLDTLVNADRPTRR